MKEGKDNLRVTLAALAISARNYVLLEIIFLSAFNVHDYIWDI